MNHCRQSIGAAAVEHAENELVLAVADAGGDGGDDAEVVVGWGEGEGEGLMGLPGGGDVEFEVRVQFEARVGCDADIADERV